MTQDNNSSPNARLTSRHDFGPRFLPSGEVEFRVWAPKCASLELVLVDASTTSYRMSRYDDGMFSLTTKVPPDARYYFRLPNGNLRPDPASRFQPDGVHGPSQIVAPELFDWTDQSWRGIELSALIIYELHIGTFTTAGTYRAAIERLDELVELGITAIELMPLNQSAGLRNWGYDGVNLYAPRNTFGTPHDLAALVDAAHARGIAVILDVVYNHFGPEGNYLHDFGSYVSDRHQSAWGDTPNFDGQHSQFVRDFILGNAAYWIEELHFDGLRLDATHCMIDDSSPHVVHELGVLFAELQSRHTRQLHLIAESNIYDPELLSPIDGGGHGFTSEWCDDFIHSVLAILRPGEHMSNRQYGPHDDLAVVLQRGYVFQGTLTEPRRRVPLAAASTRAPRERLVFAIQNHDFIGNH
ncbi:MAG: malto-oligosyltrehalose trehalohydrolase, partial [Planctomycetales bacterium]|nr:malto-oligosyltrehalose trehalohydrolase [Planctomycetales bacterium]